jgi:hypothetical protein
MRRTSSLEQRLVFVLCYGLAIALGLFYEYQLLTLILLAIGLSLRTVRFTPLPSIAGGILSGFLVFTKINLGFAALLMFLTAATTWLLQRRERALSAILSWVLSFSLTFVALTVYLIGSRGALRLWIRGSIELGSGFSEAMSVVGPSEILILGTLALVVGLHFLVRQGKPLADLAAASLVAGLLAFKHAFARQDRHVLMFFPFLLAMVAVQIGFSGGKKKVRYGLVCYLILLALTLPSVLYYDPQTAKSVGTFLAGFSASEKVVRLTQLGETVQALLEKSETNLRPSLLPDSVRKVIDEAGGQFAVIPWEISYVAANDLRWKPNPVVQTYMAYTPYLDQKMADFLGNDGEPAFLIFSFEDIDDRNLAWTTPAMFNTILERFELHWSSSDSDVVLLRRRETPLTVTWSRQGVDEGNFGTWIDVPRCEGGSRVCIDIELNAVGKLMNAVFRIPPVYAEVVTDDGRQSTFRFVPKTARNGPPTSFFLESTEDFEMLMRGADSARIVRVRLFGDGSAYYSRRLSSFAPSAIHSSTRLPSPGSGSASDGICSPVPPTSRCVPQSL